MCSASKDVSLQSTPLSIHHERYWGSDQRLEKRHYGTGCWRVLGVMKVTSSVQAHTAVREGDIYDRKWGWPLSMTGCIPRFSFLEKQRWSLASHGSARRSGSTGTGLTFDHRHPALEMLGGSKCRDSPEVGNLFSGCWMLSVVEFARHFPFPKNGGEESFLWAFHHCVAIREQDLLLWSFPL